MVRAPSYTIILLLIGGFVLSGISLYWPVLASAQNNSAQIDFESTIATTTDSNSTTTTELTDTVNTNRSTTNDWYSTEMISGNNIQTGDFVVGPGRLEIMVKPGETVTKMMTVTNRISDKRVFNLVVEDMSGSADGSGAVVLLGDQAGPYTLRDYISFPGDTVNLDLGERAQVPVTITMPINAEPGGYYGAVLVSTVQDEGSVEVATARSPIVARIGTLFFITVPGEAETGGQVVSLSTKNDKWWWQKGPIDLGILYENTGSIHLNPYGEVQIKNMFGEEVGFIELEPWFVLPKSLRLREVTWDRELLIGRYTITTKINRGYDNVIDENTIAIWVVPFKVIVIVVGVLFSIFFLIRLFLRSFEFKRKST